MNRAQLILAVYNREVSRFYCTFWGYAFAVERGNLAGADMLADRLRRRAAAIVATIAECSPEGGS